MSNARPGRPPAVKPHSHDHIDDTRLSWWRRRHLRSILDEIGCASLTTGLEVGVGGGHWAATLFGCFADPARICGVDIERHWAEVSNSYLERHMPQHRYTALLGRANYLALPDASFDIVTCQTLLMHLADPAAAVTEMVRVLKPGGFLLVAEPMNQINMAAVAHGLASFQHQASATLWAVWGAYHEAQRRRHGHDHNIAASLPTYLAAEPRLTDLRGFCSDVVQITTPEAGEFDKLARELRRSRTVKLITDMGLSPADIDAADAALQDIIADLTERSVSIASPTPQVLFAARKTAD